MDTNLTDLPTAQALEGLLDNDQQGTLFLAKIHKMGEERGPAGFKTVYGDSFVHTLIWTGFSYRALVERSDRQLRRQLNQGGFLERLARETLEQHTEATIADACAATQEIQDWFHKVLVNGVAPTLPMSGPPCVWEPLKINGRQVHGVRVYRGAARPGIPRMPIPGCAYVQGVKLGEIVLTPATNGEWRPDSRPKTIAKQLIKRRLPVGLFCQYRLEPERVSDLVVDEAAAKAAKVAGIPIDPEALRSLFKIAP